MYSLCVDENNGMRQGQCHVVEATHGRLRCDVCHIGNVILGTVHTEAKIDDTEKNHYSVLPCLHQRHP